MEILTDFLPIKNVHKSKELLYVKNTDFKQQY